jgi:hypothetical protein
MLWKSEHQFHQRRQLVSCLLLAFAQTPLVFNSVMILCSIITFLTYFVNCLNSPGSRLCNGPEAQQRYEKTDGRSSRRGVWHDFWTSRCSFVLYTFSYSQGRLRSDQTTRVIYRPYKCFDFVDLVSTTQQLLWTWLYSRTTILRLCPFQKRKKK